MIAVGQGLINTFLNLNISLLQISFILIIFIPTKR